MFELFNMFFLCVYNEYSMIKCVSQFYTYFLFSVVSITSINRRYDSSHYFEFRNCNSLNVFIMIKYFEFKNVTWLPKYVCTSCGKLRVKASHFYISNERFLNEAVMQTWRYHTFSLTGNLVFVWLFYMYKDVIVLYVV